MNTSINNGKAARLALLRREYLRNGAYFMSSADIREFELLTGENKLAQTEAVRVLKESMEAIP